MTATMFDGAAIGATTAGDAEHPVVAAVRLRARRRAAWMRLLWAPGGDGAPPTPAYPDAIRHEEVDVLLLDPSQVADEEARFYAASDDAAETSAAIAAADDRLAADARWQRLAERLGLGDDEQQLLAVAAAVAIDPQLARAYAYLHDQADVAYATPWLASVLFGPGRAPASVDATSPLVRWGVLRRIPELTPVPALLSGWIADPAVVAWLVAADDGDDADLPVGVTVHAPREFGALPELYPAMVASMVDFAGEMTAAGAPSVEIELVAPEGSGRRTAAGQFAARRNEPLLVVHEATLLRDATDADVAPRVVAAARAARLRGALLYWASARDGHPLAASALRQAHGLRVVGRAVALPDQAPDGVAFRSYELPPLTQAARLALWRSLTTDEPPPQLREWLLTPAEIVQIRRVHRAGPDAIRQACRRPVESANLLVRLPLPFGRHDLVLPPSVQEQLDDFEQQVRHRWSVYEEWGFERLCPNGRGVVALFAGPSGTGKTMAAQVLARSLGMDLYRLDAAAVVNKYIGETEKKLKLIFDECDRANFLLLIDECEGMFGQRFSSKDAHDRYANLEIDYLLQRLERFQGVAVLATNRKNDIDPAFLRRLRMVIDFLAPGPDERRTLWRDALVGPAARNGAGRGAESGHGDEDERARSHYVGDVAWDALAEKVTLTGAEIKLAALNAAFLARSRDERIGMPHVLTAVRRELAKKGQTLRGFE